MQASEATVIHLIMSFLQGMPDDEGDCTKRIEFSESLEAHKLRVNT